MEMELKSVFLIAIVAVAMIGMMVPSVFAELGISCNVSSTSLVNHLLFYRTNQF